jgi:shikimate kinase
MMGAGKSSVGRCLQHSTGLARVDTDELVAAKFGMSIDEIFHQHGEEHFRTAETEVLRELAGDRPMIIVSGGGLILRKENVDLLKQLGAIVWLQADEKTLFERATRRGGRPLLETENPAQSFSEILKTRTPIYESVADIRIDTARRSHEEVADLILAEIENRSAA